MKKRCDVYLKEEIHGVKLFIIKHPKGYSCFFEGRKDFPIMESEIGAYIEGLCAYQEITGILLER